MEVFIEKRGATINAGSVIEIITPTTSNEALILCFWPFLMVSEYC